MVRQPVAWSSRISAAVPRPPHAVRGDRMKTYLVYTAAALAEIAGCFSFWAWLRLDKPAWWLTPGMVALALFAWLLTLSDSDAAGRAYAAYGGIYIAVSLLWLWMVESRVRSEEHTSELQSLMR